MQIYNSKYCYNVSKVTLWLKYLQKISKEVLLGVRKIFKTSDPVLIFPTSGTIEVMGSRNVQSSRIKREIGYLPEGAYYPDFLKGEEILRYYGKLYGLTGAALNRRIDEVIATDAARFTLVAQDQPVPQSGWRDDAHVLLTDVQAVRQQSPGLGGEEDGLTTSKARPVADV